MLAVCALTGLFVSSRGTPAWAVAAHGGLFVTGLMVWLTALQLETKRLTWIILGLALVARLLLLPYPASDDVNRYLWEGGLVLAGESPYAGPADLAPPEHRDAFWAAMNNKDKLTAYPPLAQLVFAAAVAVAHDPLAMKLLFVFAEMASLMLLAGMLRRRALPVAHLALVAFNPVLLLGMAAEGHFDALFVLATLAALDARERRRDRSAWVWLAAAVQIKIVAVLLVPLFLRKRGWRTAWAFLPLLVLPALPFANDLPNLARGILAFGTGARYNGFLDAIVLGAVGSPAAAAAIGYGLLALWTALVTLRVEDDARGAFFVLGGLIVLAPVTHYWYLSWIVPFLALVPQPAWLLLTGLQAFYFTAWMEEAVTGIWHQPAWVWWAEWLPFALLLVPTAWPRVRALLSRRRAVPAGPPPATVSAIVPVINEERRIAGCVETLQRQGLRLTEVVVVDGGSIDETVDRAEKTGAVVVAGPRGRGTQIAAGVRVASGDVLWIVHADTTPHPKSVDTMLAALGRQPDAAGGMMGQRFSRLPAPLTVIEWLNAVRGCLFGIGFGDQGQFVRRDALPGIGGYPALPLMEDVELSLRLRGAGPVLYLGRNGTVSTRRWDTSHPWRRVSTVCHLIFIYLMSGRKQELSAELFDRYYATGARTRGNGADPDVVICPEPTPADKRDPLGDSTHRDGT